MKWIIDRIEGDIAVCEADDAMLNIPLCALPDNVKENDVISVDIDSDETKARKENINKLMNNLFKD